MSMDTTEHILTERRGRPRLPEGSRFRKVTISLPPDLLARLDELAGERSPKVAEAVEQWLGARHAQG